MNSKGRDIVEKKISRFIEQGFLQQLLNLRTTSFYQACVLQSVLLRYHFVPPSFKNKIRYAPYVSPGSQISHIGTNKGNINRQCSIYNVLSVKNITLDSKQRKDNSDYSGEDSNSIGTTDWLITSLIPPNSSNLVPTQDFSKI